LFESHKTQCPTKNNEYHVKISKTIKEACELLKDSFEYDTEEYNEGGKILQKTQIIVTIS